ncbi:fatty-acid amide hydrolase 2-A-like [Oppia nitens]|uniref:fatty-acid amide hydrolase 2-A-like n=1 Tax=Oppia nitens TaxID=1686743 RepID=UPI0023DA15ED|nr:fatty-acid amide hydrolase 2-A-like [Oppia nitens]
MVCVIYHLKQCIRLVFDLMAKIIGLIYPSKQQYLPPITDRLLLEPVVNLTKQIKSGQLKSEDLVKAYINRIKIVEPHINAVIDERYELAIEEAIEVDKRVKHELAGNPPLNGLSIDSQPLLGIPFSGKDSVAIKGMRYTSGCPTRKDIKATDDAGSVRHMRSAGAIPVCLTNVPELLMWWNAHNKTFGQTYNPYDKSIIPGGSTGGNASLIAAAGSIVGIASDIGGSTRIPCFYCGVFGHCTTPELVPTDNHWPPYPEKRLKMLSYGPMVRYAVDIKPVLKVFLGDNVTKLKLDETVDLSKLKIYYMYEINDPLVSRVSPQIHKAIDDCVNHLKSLGATIQEINLKQFEHSFLIWQSSMRVDGITPFAEELTNRTGKINPMMELLKSIYGGSEHSLEAICVSVFDANPPKDDVLVKYKQLGEELKSELHKLLGDDGVLLFPPQPDPEVKLNTTLLNFRSCVYTAVFNCLQVAITSVPLGLNTQGLPLGVQVIAKAFNDHLTIAVAEELEKRFGGWVAPTKINC